MLYSPKFQELNLSSLLERLRVGLITACKYLNEKQKTSGRFSLADRLNNWNLKLSISVVEIEP